MPVVLGGIFIAFCLFYYLDQKRKIRNEQRRERSKEKFEQLIEQLKHSDKIDKQQQREGEAKL